ncbi:hypothetical protein MMC30_002108 [Trapelia coarctata]|nr:hypothetical protein [Trapelia coarctata]
MNGIPVVLLAFRALVGLGKEEDKDYSFSRQNWQRDETNHERGESVFKFLYQKDYNLMLTHFSAHKDFDFASIDICYGLFLGHHDTLELKESELVILGAIMSQNLKGPSMWHLRGCRRAGISAEDTELV